jgi:hypothetical protein
MCTSERWEVCVFKRETKAVRVYGWGETSLRDRKGGRQGRRGTKKGCSERGKTSAWEKEMSGYWCVK